jgi:hypothetical protein
MEEYRAQTQQRIERIERELGKVSAALSVHARALLLNGLLPADDEDDVSTCPTLLLSSRWVPRWRRPRSRCCDQPRSWAPTSSGRRSRGPRSSGRRRAVARSRGQARRASQVHVAWSRLQARRASAQASGATTARSPPHKATCQKATCQKCTPRPLGTRRPMACLHRDGPACKPAAPMRDLHSTPQRHQCHQRTLEASRDACNRRPRRRPLARTLRSAAGGCVQARDRWARAHRETARARSETGVSRAAAGAGRRVHAD